MPKKATGWDNIPPKLMKIAAKELSQPISSMINKSIRCSVFPADLKKAEVSPIYKAKDNLFKGNYRPISILPCISKVYERVMYDQLYQFVHEVLSPLLSAFRKHYGCNHVVTLLLENCKRALERGEHTGVILMDLSKAFDCLPHDLLLHKLKCYGLSEAACTFINSYLSSRFQRVKIGSTKSEWSRLTMGVPQGSVMGPLLFNIFINYLLYKIGNECFIYNYADDNTLSYSNVDIELVKEHLEYCTSLAPDWCKNNGMRANADKFQAFVISPRLKKCDVEFLVNGIPIQCKSPVKLLGVKLDDNLTFEHHIKHMCHRASRQINALSRISKYIDVDVRMSLYRAFIESNFQYCNTVWHFCSKASLFKLEKLNKRALRVVLNDHISCYSDLLSNSKCTSLYLSRIKTIAIETFKCINGINPEYLSIFDKVEHKYESRRGTMLRLPKVVNEMSGKHSFGYQGAKIWNELPIYLKHPMSLQDFKNNISAWEGPDCLCGSCILCQIKQF